MGSAGFPGCSEDRGRAGSGSLDDYRLLTSLGLESVCCWSTRRQQHLAAKILPGGRHFAGLGVGFLCLFPGQQADDYFHETGAS